MAGLFCDVCIASGSLCASCQGRLDCGQVNKMDLSVSTFVFENLKKFALEKVRIAKCFDNGRVAIVVTESDPGLLIGKEGRVVTALAKSLNRHVKVIGRHAEMHAALLELLKPVRFLGINEIFGLGGRMHKVRIAKKELARLPMDRGTLSEVIGYVFNGNARLSFE